MRHKICECESFCADAEDIDICGYCGEILIGHNQQKHSVIYRKLTNVVIDYGIDIENEHELIEDLMAILEK